MFQYCCPNQCSNYIENCQTMSCNSNQRPFCSTCKQYNVRGAEFSMAWPEGPLKCNPTCSWFNHNCWPGTCGKSHLARNCQCNQGFVVDKTNQNTKCELEKGPNLMACDFGIKSQYGDISNFRSSSGCHSEQDIFVKFIPNAISLQIESLLTLNVTM
ncbi:uncharacterized protein LOC118765007, partial [Octopus sinensis]|uniref:Uncharacterized protein LOC118765007 n=1 Tax=Octopus sinensis TaxID=2607531 RepID=A0A7E6F5B0_9MOLL